MKKLSIKLSELYNKLPHFMKGGFMLFIAFAVASLIVGTIVFLCTPGVHL